jgi:hypothetical protein
MSPPPDRIGRGGSTLAKAHDPDRLAVAQGLTIIAVVGVGIGVVLVEHRQAALSERGYNPAAISTAAQSPAKTGRAARAC